MFQAQYAIEVLVPKHLEQVFLLLGSLVGSWNLTNTEDRTTTRNVSYSLCSIVDYIQRPGISSHSALGLKQYCMW